MQNSGVKLTSHCSQAKKFRKALQEELAKLKNDSSDDAKLPLFDRIEKFMEKYAFELYLQLLALANWP
jgi:hypothetical protein